MLVEELLRPRPEHTRHFMNADTIWGIVPVRTVAGTIDKPAFSALLQPGSDGKSRGLCWCYLAFRDQGKGPFNDFLVLRQSFIGPRGNGSYCVHPALITLFRIICRLLSWIRWVCRLHGLLLFFIFP